MPTARKNKIAPSGLFCIIFVSRLVVCLTSVHSISNSEIKPCVLVSYALSILLTAALCVPAVLCAERGRNPLDVKWLGAVYFLYFSYICAVNISRFSYFASTVLNPETQGWVFAAIMCVCTLYGAVLGIEALSRFSAFCCALLLLGVGSVILCNVGSFNDINLYPVMTTGRADVLKNALIFSSNTVEPAVLLGLCGRVNGSVARPFVRSVTTAYLAVFLLLVFIVGTMGDNAAIQNFPFYTFFQISKFSSFERLDVFHLSFWIMGVFVRSTAALYCASVSLTKARRKLKRQNACAAGTVIVFISSALLLKADVSSNFALKSGVIPFFVFCVIIPLLTYLFKKRNLGDELVKAL